MKDKIKIRETIIKGTEIVLWKNFTKDPLKNNYNITVSKKDMMFISVSSINKRDLSYIISKYESILAWINFMLDSDEEEKYESG